jgi:hypothetical protein
MPQIQQKSGHPGLDANHGHAAQQALKLQLDIQELLAFLFIELLALLRVKAEKAKIGFEVMPAAVKTGQISFNLR